MRDDQGNCIISPFWIWKGRIRRTSKASGWRINPWGLKINKIESYLVFTWKYIKTEDGTLLPDSFVSPLHSNSAILISHRCLIWGKAGESTLSLMNHWWKCSSLPQVESQHKPENDQMSSFRGQVRMQFVSLIQGGELLWEHGHTFKMSEELKQKRKKNHIILWSKITMLALAFFHHSIFVILDQTDMLAQITMDIL